MAVLEILEFPDPRLRKQATPVKEVTDATRTLIDDMFETMYAAPGIGLAATQVNNNQVAIQGNNSQVDTQDNNNQVATLVNNNQEDIQANNQVVTQDNNQEVMAVHLKASQVLNNNNVAVSNHNYRVTCKATLPQE